MNGRALALTAELIGVCFDGMGRAGGQARAPEVLRAAGLGEVFGPEVVLGEDILTTQPSNQRAPGRGFLNQAALLAMIAGVHERVGTALQRGHFPVLYGADCAVLLAAVPAVRDALGDCGLLFVDAHEDATPFDVSESGEAANMEVRLLTGADGDALPIQLGVALPAVPPEGVAMLGIRDALHRERLGVPSVAERLFLRSADAVLGNPALAASDAADHIESSAARFWLHVDFDVLSTDEFAGCGGAGDPALPGGLTWEALTEIVASAMERAACCGLSLAVYNPDRDPDGTDAARIVAFARTVCDARRRALR